MNVNQEKENQEALWLGKSFMKMPRKVLTLSVGTSKKGRQFARIYMALVAMSYFKSGFMKLGKKLYACQPGEFYCTYQYLADRTDTSSGSIGYFLKELANEGLIEFSPVPGGTKFKICNYNYFLVRIADDKGDAAFAAKAMADAEHSMGGRSKQFSREGGNL